MARPNSIADVTDRTNLVATFHTEFINTSPIMLKHYAAFIETAQKFNGQVKPNKWNKAQIEVFLPKSKEELEMQLIADQNSWDYRKEEYDKAVNRDSVSDEFDEYKQNRIKEFAKQNGFPNPFDVFSANDSDLDEIRRELELQD